MSDEMKSNRRNWDERASIHLRDTTEFYMIDRFLAGADTLFPIESAEIGEVAGKRLLHLQCHIGLDTLSLARRGALVTGLDFSPVALRAAREFAARSGIPARFIESDVYNAPKSTGDQYEIVFTTWGTITWLPDVHRWARTIAAVLTPGGRLYFLDTHPFAMTLEEQDGALTCRYPWRTSPESPLVCDEDATYTGDPTPLVSRITCQWVHPLGDIISSLIDAGLSIRWIREHTLLPYRHFKMLIDAGQRMFRLPADKATIPLSLSIEARKAGG